MRRGGKSALMVQPAPRPRASGKFFCCSMWLASWRAFRQRRHALRLEGCFLSLERETRDLTCSSTLVKQNHGRQRVVASEATTPANTASPFNIFQTQACAHIFLTRAPFNVGVFAQVRSR